MRIVCGDPPLMICDKFEHMLFCFKTTGSDDSACKVTESCGNLHRSAKKESFPKREAFIRELSAATRR